MYEIICFLTIVVPILISVAMLTLAERKLMGSMQRRIGPETSGIFGLLQPIADGLKLVIKEFAIPKESYLFIFVGSSILSFVMSLVIWTLIPISSGYTVFELSNNILISMAIGGVSIYGILLSGWSGNSKYALLGSIRSAAQMISYELSITLIILTIIIGNNYNFSTITLVQTKIYNILLYWPIAILYFITILAETNRAPFDLPEAESELVSGFNTEHSSLPFAYFFLAEYGFMISQSLIYTNIFLGGCYIPYISIHPLLYPLISSLKVIFILFLFILIRASLPRFRYDLLQDFAWNSILPVSLVYLNLHILFLF